ncbi:hypothetical protein PsorP6_010655 [Peronosclerospora sorghi]|uniref:Uncharacterized protein n=1 Tax=Peronosclerospora sorghi TaxID=230839 RepID=A0ACC0VW74_9STRA|nr:hypothetical protein PsorP6_010655 [Peronosclerospora sorghi]
MKVVCVSDTHGLHEDARAIPPGDVLVHAGDFTDTGERSEVLAFNAFLGRLPHRYKLVIAGNHESSFDRAFYPKFWYQYGHRQEYDPDEVRALLTNALYLEDQAVVIEGYVFYGTPWQPEFCNWAFNLPRGEALRRHWRRIPTDTDVLITHTPPMGHGDLVGDHHVGCEDLLHEVEHRVRPKLHVFGHVHEGYGQSFSPDHEITYLNASTCTHSYEPVNPPFVFELTGSPKRGWPQHTLDMTTTPSASSSSSRGMRRSLSTDAVNDLFTTGKREDEDMKVTQVEPKDYALMLHEWLRLCSHKPPFIAKEVAVTSKGNLNEFRVDGTTAGLLFESTLKLRPVINVQKRALRYLFAQGFQSNSDNYKCEERESQQEGQESPSDRSPIAGERRKYGLSRRVTVAVLDDIDEEKEGMDERDRERVQQARVAAAALGKVDAERPQNGHSRRSRRDKTLQRRSAVPKLAALPEEPNEGGVATTEECSVDVETTTPVSETNAVAAACVLCKYKVPGHVHAVDETSLKDVTTISEASVKTSSEGRCNLCEDNVAGHVHHGAQSTPSTDEESMSKNELRSRTDNVPSKRLSSWF